MRRLTLIAPFVCVVFATTASAAETMKSGLWEMSMKSDEMTRTPMPDLSAAQLEQMRQLGVPVPQTRNGALIQQVCITKEAAARQDPPGGPRESDCKTKSHERRGDGFRAEIVCDGSNRKGTGTIKGTYSGNTAYSSVYDFKGTARGQPVTQHLEMSGKWMSADCGNVRPMGEVFGGPRK
jgi:hypothetical protein